MPRRGAKNISYAQRCKMVRKTPKQMADHDSPFVEEYRTLIESFSKEQYLQYEKLIHSWGTPGRSRRVMLDLCIKNNITGPVFELATIRNDKLDVHQKLIQLIRSRWTTIYEYQKNTINNDSEKFWLRMARAIQRRCRTEGYVLHLEWQDTNGLTNLVNWLKDRFEKQNGLCAISDTQMILQIGETRSSKCSPDRKNSNLGYTPDNLWLVTSWVNFMKLDMPLIVFYSKIEAIHLARNKNITV